MKLRWNTSELTISGINNGYFKDLECIDLLKECLIQDDEYEKGELKLYPSRTSIYIDDSGRIEACTDLSEFLQYYSSKQGIDRDNYLFIINEEKCIVKELKDYSNINSVYQEMISSIIIDIPNVSRSLLNFSPLTFDDIQDVLRENNIEVGKAINFVIQFLSLIPIADKVFYDEDTKIFSFAFMDAQKEKRAFIKLKWKEYERFTNNFFYQSYLWIISDKNKGIGIDLKRNIVNSYLNNIDNLELIMTLSDNQVNEMVSHFDDILKW